MTTLDRLMIGGIRTVRATKTELASRMLKDHALAAQGELPLPRVVVSSNGSVIAAFHHKKDFKALILQADIVDADGMPLVLTSRLLCKRPLAERVATTDFIHDAADAAIRNGLSFYFLGGKPGVADKAARKLLALHPGLQIAGTRHGYFSTQEEAVICAEIVERKTDVLWVGLGSPRQEGFAIANRERLGGLTWIRTCGGLFDHCAGHIKRAPRWMQSFGLEWLFRVVQEPRRLGRRYLTTNPLATYHLLTKTYDAE